MVEPARDVPSIPGPSLPRFLATWIAARGDRWEIVRRLRRRFGDLVAFRLGRRVFVLVSHPAPAREILVAQQRRFRKGLFYGALRRVQGDGMATAEGEEWRRQREEVQRYFMPRRLAEGAPGIVATAVEWAAERHADETVDLAAEMRRISLVNTTQVLFHVSSAAESHRILPALIAMMDAADQSLRAVLPLGRWLDRLPLPSNLRLRAAHRTLDALLYRWIDERSRAPEPRPDDVLTTVATGAEASTEEGRSRRRAARDQLLTLLFAGVETTSASLSGVWYRLGSSPDAERRLHQELDTTLGGAAPTMADLERLPFLDRVIREALRLSPGATSLSRTPVCPVDLTSIPAHIGEGSSVGLSSWMIHHDPRFFARPDDFDPDRWDDGRRDVAAERAYFPFGLGARRCIGEHLALIEMALTVATIAQRHRVALIPRARYRLKAGTLLRPFGRWPARVEPR